MPAIPSRIRPTLRIETLVLVVVVYLVAAANGAWWSAVAQGRDWSHPANWLFIACTFITLVGLHFVLIAPFAFRWIVRVLLSVIVAVTAVATYYMHTFAVMFDPTMIQNVLHTDTHEVRDLLSWSMVGWVLAWSIAPIAFIWLVRLGPVPPLRALMVRTACVLGALLIALLAVLPVSRDFSSFMRNQREARYLITPGNLLYGIVAQSLRGARAVNAPREVVGADARLAAPAAGDPRVLVLVLGETARAANFSLLGYPRETNPELAVAGVTAFRDVTSCGTSTEVSVPCMFSPYGRANYDERRIHNSEGLLDVLTRAGYQVKWLDNQSGCKGVCKGRGVEYEKLAPSLAPELCSGGECRDEILVRRLADELPRVTRNTVFVLHMMGNHGPAYFRRYPAAFRRFLPDCATAELRECTREEVVNSYDNAILYTDHVLASAIRTLSADPRQLDAAMIYVSDHGESLGERGLYLHGIPYAIAPQVQTRVPMLVWLSKHMTDSGEVNPLCLRGKAGAHWSHDNLFHSVLGLADVETRAYVASSDIFDGCRAGVTRAAVRTR